MTRLEVIRAATVLPALRTPVRLRTADGFSLVGELALPEHGSVAGALIMLHPLPTHGGMMDSHIFKKAANRLPSMAEITVIRFNTRGTESDQGKSEGEFGNGVTEEADVIAAINYAFDSLKVKNLWIVGWSFGTDLALQYATDKRIKGLILLSPPLLTTKDSHLDFWAKDGRPVVALVPEFDEFLNPTDAQIRFKTLTSIDLIAVAGAKHLWVGEPFVHRVLSEIVKYVNPSKLPLATEY